MTVILLMWYRVNDRFTYTVGDGHSSAKDGTIYLVSPEGILASAEFDTGAGTWQVIAP